MRICHCLIVPTRQLDILLFIIFLESMIFCSDYVGYSKQLQQCFDSFGQGLWLRLLKLGTTDDPLSSFEYGTILGMLFIFSYPLFWNCMVISSVLIDIKG